MNNAQTAQTATLRPHPAAALSSLHVTVEDLSETQDDALMQVFALAKLAKAALDGETGDATDIVGHALAAIAKLAATAMEELDCSMQDIREYAKRAVVSGVSPFGSVTPLEGG